MGVGLAMGESFADRSLQAFLIAISTAIGLAVVFHMFGQGKDVKLFRREALCSIGLSWILATIIGGIPYVFSESCNWADALFESASGLTTTGATAFQNFSEFPASLLFWRSLSQWVGGLGVVVFFVAILNSLGAGAKILFSNESSGTSSDFDQGRIQKGVFELMLFYLGITIACALAYKIAGMSGFQAINHAMTTTATGGFSTEADSIAAFQSPTIEWIAILFMGLSATTFVYMIRLIRRKNPAVRKQGHEIGYFYAIIVGTTVLLALYLSELRGEWPNHDSIRTAAFQATSIMTTTGYTSADFNTWLTPAKILLMILMFIGGCSGSTAGGVKVVRIIIVLSEAFRSIAHAFRPRRIIPVRVIGRNLKEGAIHNVILFLALMASLQIFSMLVVSALEPQLEFLDVFSSVQATLFNIGPGFGVVGPTQSFHFFQPTTKVFFSLLMIMGRLELYAVMVLVFPGFWRRFS